MQARRSILVFTILLSLACLYQISFSFVTNSVESKAEKRAKTKLDSIVKGSGILVLGKDTLYTKKPVDFENIKNYLEENELRKVTHKPAYPITGKTYAQCKQNEMALGLDLKGGMAVTMEISYPTLVENLAGNTQKDVFTKPFNSAKNIYRTSTDDFITIFEKEFTKMNGTASLASIFAIGDQNLFTTKMTNAEVIQTLRNEAKNALDRTEYIISNRINKFGVTEPNIQKQPLTGRILLELPGVKDKERIRKMIQTTANLEFWETYDNDKAWEYLNQANDVLARELYGIETKDSTSTTDAADSTKTSSDTTTTIASDTVKNDTTQNESANLLNNKNKNEKKDSSTKGANNNNQQLSQEERNRKYPIYRYLYPATEKGQGQDKNSYYQQGCRVGQCLLADTNSLNTLLAHKSIQNGVLPNEMRLMWGNKPDADGKGGQSNLISLYAIKVTNRDGGPALDGKHVVTAYQDFDQASGRATVNMSMDSEGADSWARLTDANKPDPNGKKHAIAIVLDNTVYSAPTVQGRIPDGSSVIQGDFSVEEATDLANILKAGSLPTKAQIVDEAIVGPTLGAENIESGFISFVASFILILIYMILFYNRAGLVANIALLANVFFLMGSLASVGATLTLPGIAGIVLTMGMAVDGNVLIYERIKELLRAGKTVKQAVDEGFKGSYATIIDANVTNLLIGIVLAVFGTGPMRGFAVTLIIGIFTSVFCSIFITRLVVSWFLERKKTLSFSFGWSEKFLANTNYDFVKRRKLYYAISSVFIVAGFTSLFMRSLDFGVEFTGGRTYVVSFEKAPDYDEVKKELAANFIEEGKPVSPEVKMIENKFKAKITTNYMINSVEDAQHIDTIVQQNLEKGLAKFGKTEIESSRKIDKVISAAFVKSAIIAVVLSVLIMFLYILLRFQKWQYGLGTAVALFHDVLFVIGLYSLLHGILPFTLEVDQAFIAAILTIMGYSINDTVVVFDRIREYLRAGRKESQEVLINEALNSTLSRTVNNSITIAVVLCAIFFFGPESIKGFIFALMIGVVVGTYSSICIATPILVDFASKKKEVAKK